jgi:hypothetical protein
MYLPGSQPNCFVCGKPWDPDAEYVYFCDEWDCWICRKCVHRFLQTAEGEVVLGHGHSIQIIEEGPSP